MSKKVDIDAINLRKSFARHEQHVISTSTIINMVLVLLLIYLYYYGGLKTDGLKKVEG